MNRHKLLFIVNPHSGRAMIKYRALDAIEAFSAAGYLVTVCPTTRAGEAEELVAAMGGDYDRIVVSGGDGTVNEAVNGLMKLPRKVPLGIMPAGTTNDYAYTLGIPTLLAEAAKTAVSDKLFDIDLGLFNSRYFTYIAAFGLFTEVTYETPQDLKNVLGYVAYALEGAKKILDINTFKIKIEHDGETFEDEFIIGLVSNTVSVAGLRTAMTGAQLDDGLLEVTLVRSPKTLSDIQAIINILLDLENMSTIESDFLTHFSTKRAVFTSEETIKWTVDGESGGALRHVEIANAHLAASVVTGEKFIK